MVSSLLLRGLLFLRSWLKVVLADLVPQVLMALMVRLVALAEPVESVALAELSAFPA